MKPFLRKHPEILALMQRRPEIYNSQIKKLKSYVREGKAVIISPESDKGMSMITKNKKLLAEYYNKGYNDAMRVMKNCTY